MTRFKIDALFERERERESKRFRHIYNDSISFANLLISWQEFLQGKRKRKDVAKFALHFMDNIFELHCELANKTYRHSNYQGFKINDPKPRKIYKASVRDRLIHHAIYRVLYPYFDRKFVYDSYSCRNKKGTHRAIRRLQRYFWVLSNNNRKSVWILKCDIRQFFANIDHQVLKDILANHIVDDNGLWLVSNIIDSFNSESKIDIGLPLGNLTSQLFINIYMNEFDQFAKRELKVKYYIRYADDFIMPSESKSYLIELLPKIREFLNVKLKLNFHPDKISIKTLASGIDYLGYITFCDHRTLRTKTKKRMLKRVNAKNRSSYLGLLKHCRGYILEQKIGKIIENQVKYKYEN